MTYISAAFVPFPCLSQKFIWQLYRNSLSRKFKLIWIAPLCRYQILGIFLLIQLCIIAAEGLRRSNLSSIATSAQQTFGTHQTSSGQYFYYTLILFFIFVSCLFSFKMKQHMIDFQSNISHIKSDYLSPSGTPWKIISFSQQLLYQWVHLCVYFDAENLEAYVHAVDTSIINFI